MNALLVLFLLRADFIVLDSIHLGYYVNGVAFGNGKVWADENSNDYIYKINPSTMQIIGSFYYPGGLDGLGFDGIYLWLGYYPSQIRKIDTLGNTIGAWTSPGATYSYGMTFDGVYLWHTDKNLKKLYKLDPNNPTNVLGEWNLNFYPRDLAFFEGKLLIASEIPANRIYIIDTAGMATLDSMLTGSRTVAGVGVGGGFLWVGTTATQGWLYKCDLSTKIKEKTYAQKGLEEKIKLYPLPARDYLILSLNSGSGKVEIKLFNVTGEFIKTIYKGNSPTPRLILSTKDLKSGVYILKTITEKEEFQKRFLILK